MGKIFARAIKDPNKKTNKKNKQKQTKTNLSKERRTRKRTVHFCEHITNDLATRIFSNI